MRLTLTPFLRKAMHRERKQLKRETFYCGGKGGQKQNKTETGVRITDTVTGIACEGREHRTQLQNQRAAMERLVLALFAHYQEEERRARISRFKADGREVRVYKQPMGIVKCGRSGRKFDYDNTLDGKLTPIITECLMAQANDMYGETEKS